MKVLKIKLKVSWMNTSGADLEGSTLLAVESSGGGFQTSEGWFSEDQAELVETIDLTALEYEKNSFEKKIEELEREIGIQKSLVDIVEDEKKELQKMLDNEKEFKVQSGPIMIPPTIERDSVQSLLGSGVKKVSLEFE